MKVSSCNMGMAVSVNTFTLNGKRSITCQLTVHSSNQIFLSVCAMLCRGKSELLKKPKIRNTCCRIQQIWWTMVPHVNLVHLIKICQPRSHTKWSMNISKYQSGSRESCSWCIVVIRLHIQHIINFFATLHELQGPCHSLVSSVSFREKEMKG